MPNSADRLAAALGRSYRIERELGAGGMATVYLAHDLKHDRDVAIKVLHPDLGAALGGERFLSEIRTTARLQHPHILPLLDSGEADGLLYYVMPLVTGETLRTRLERERQLPITDALLIAREVSDALHYAHGLGIIHRDIKPENILLQGGHALVADFGIALAVQSAGGARMTQTGLSLGTPQYMSPEQAMGEKTIDARSDVYALGAMTYEMLAGEPPFTGPTVQAIVAKVISSEPVPLASLRKAVPLNVAAAVHMALEKLPADRCETAKVFIEALANAAFIGTASSRAQPAAVSGPPRALRALGITASLVATAAVSWWLTSRNADAPAAVHFAFSAAPSQPLSNSPRSNLALSPDGRTLVYATIDSAGVRRLFRRALDDLEPQSITGTEGAQSPFVSPNGKEVGFLLGGNLMKIPIDGGTPQLLAKVDNSHGAAWGPRGVVTTVNGRLAMIPAGGGTPSLVTSADSAVPGFWPVFLPGGDVVVYATEPGLATTTLSAVDVRSGHVTPLGLPGRGALGVSHGELIFVRQDLAVMAVPFDVGALRVTGSARAIVPRIQGYAPTGEIKAALSASGTLAYVPGSDGFRMVTVDLHGVQRPTKLPAGPHAFPRYSPDGRQIASEKQASGQNDIFIYDVASGAERRLTTEGTDNSRPEWSADGTRIVYRSGSPGSFHSLWSRRADGSGAPVQLLAVPGKPIWEGQLTPDGTMVVYRIGSGPDADIFYQRLSGDRMPVAIAATRFKENGVRVSPDGRWVAYGSDESGTDQVYVRPFPGPGAAVPVSLAGGVNPAWSRDGRTLFYADKSRFIAASIAANPLFTVIERRTLFETFNTLGPGAANYDVAPDGNSLLMLLPVEGMREEIVVMHNWASESSAPANRGRPK